MAPKDGMTGNTRKTKREKTIFGLLQKFKLLKRNNDVEKENLKQHDLEFDAIPDTTERGKQEEEEEEEEDSYRNSNTQKENPKPSEAEDKFDFTSASNGSKREYKERSSRSMPKTSQSFWPFKDQSSPQQNFYTQINGGSYFQIGNNYNVTVNGGQLNHQKNNNSANKTREISALFRCRDAIESGHLDYLAGHFGDKWEQIGKALGFSEGEVNKIKKKVKKREDSDYDKERGFQMLMKWCQLQEEKPSVGTLAEVLWDTEVSSGREAVKRLSVDIVLFQDS